MLRVILLSEIITVNNVIFYKPSKNILKILI